MNRYNTLIVIMIFLGLASGCSTTHTRDEILRQAELIKEEYRRAEGMQEPEVSEAAPEGVFTALPQTEAEPVTTTHPETSSAQEVPVSVPQSPALRPVRPEKLVFTARYLGMTVAELTTEVKERKMYKGVPVIVFEAAGRTIPPFSKVFKVEDVFISYMDERRKRVVYREEYRSEGKYRKHSFVEFNYEKHIAYFYNDVDKTRKEIPIPDQVHDPVTANYYVRTLAWQLGDTIDLQVYASETIYDLICLVSEVTEQGTPNHGKRKALVVQPYAYVNGEDAKKGRAKGYFDMGRAHIPLKAVIKTPFFGSAQLILERIEHQTFSAE
ncbi:MAG: DUF3108 domain-containing protein [Candidatus Omnitrophica bacterium]|nr:DUF3108 domain-containing protein [Candidatus Omnitrophota bacterium]